MSVWTHAAVWRPSCVHASADKMAVRRACAQVWQPCVRDACADETAAAMPSVLGVFQRSSPWFGSASVVVCTRVLSAELDRCLLKSV